MTQISNLALGYINQALFVFSSFPHSTSSRFCLFTSTSPVFQTHIRLYYKMVSFRSILFAAAAFATVVSAIPTPDISSNEHTDLIYERGASQYPGDYYQTCRDTLAPIIVELGQCYISYI